MAGQIQLSALGLQDEYLSGSPKMSFFNKIFTNISPFFIKSKEIPVNGSTVTFNNSHICEIKKDGDILRSITLKIVLPSLFIEGAGLSYPVPSNNFEPQILFLDKNYNTIFTRQAKSTILYYNTLNKSWVPPNITITDDTRFSFVRTSGVSFFGFMSQRDALFWGFKNERTFKNGMFIYDYSVTSQLTLENSGWVKSYFPYFRYYKQNTGFNIFNKIELYVGGQLIESITSEYIKIYNQLNLLNSQQTSINVLAGSGNIPSTSQSEYYVKIPFTSKNISISSLLRHNIEVSIFTNDFLGVLESNAYNPVRSSNIIDYVNNVKAAFTDGFKDFVITTTAIRTLWSNLNTAVLNNFAVSTTSFSDFVISHSNIYCLDIANPFDPVLVRYNSLSNSLARMQLANCVVYNRSSGLVGSRLGIFNYTTEGSVQRIHPSIYNLDIPFNTIGIVYSFNNSLGGTSSVFDYAIITVDNLIFIQNLSLPTTFIRIVAEFGTPLAFSHGRYQGVLLNSLYYITKTNLVNLDVNTGNQTSIFTWSSADNPTHIVVFDDVICVIFNFIDFSIFSSAGIRVDSGKLPSTVTDVAATKNNRILYITKTSGGVTTFNLTTKRPSSDELDVSNVYSNIILTSQFSYFFSQTKNLLMQIENSIQWPVSTNKFVSLVLPDKTFFAVDDSDRKRLYFTNNTSTSLQFCLNTSLFGSISTEPSTSLQIQGLSNLYFDGDYIYSFPFSGSSNVFRYNTNSNFFLPASYQYVTVRDDQGQFQPIFSGTQCSDGTIISSFSLQTACTLIQYDTTLPFTDSGSFTTYDLSSIQTVSQSNYTKSVLYKDRIVFSSNLVLNRFNTSTKGDSVQRQSLPKLGRLQGDRLPINAGSSFDGSGNIFTFTSNLSANGIFRTEIRGLSISSTRLNPISTGLNPAPMSHFGKYNTIVGLNDKNTVYVIPNNHMNLIQYNMRTDTYSNINIISTFPTMVPNGSNTACVAGNRLYVFPTEYNRNTFVLDTTTNPATVVANINTNNNFYVSSVYDGSRFIYLTDPYANIVRFNTTLDIFNDYSGYTFLDTNRLNINDFTDPVAMSGNIYITTSANIYSWNIQNQTLAGNVLIRPEISSTPILNRQTNGSNIISFASGSNIYIFSTNTFTGNLFTINLAQRSVNSSKTILDITSNLSNIWISWSDNSLGLLNYGSNDYSGIYTITPLPSTAQFSSTNERPSNMIAFNGNIFTIASNSIVRINAASYTTNFESRIINASRGPTSNNYKFTTIVGNNIYVFPTTGNVITKVPENRPLSQLETTFSNVTNISAVVTVNGFMYAASRDSNIVFQFDTTSQFTSTNFTTYQMLSRWGNSFSSAYFNSLDSNVYFLPYKGNTVTGYRLNTLNFSNSVGTTVLTTMPNFTSALDYSRSGTTDYLLSSNQITSISSSGAFLNSPIRVFDKISNKWKFKHEIFNFGPLIFVTVDTQSYAFLYFSLLFPDFTTPVYQNLGTKDFSDNTDPTIGQLNTSGFIMSRITWYFSVPRDGLSFKLFQPNIASSRRIACQCSFFETTPATQVRGTQTIDNSNLSSHKRYALTITTFNSMRFADGNQSIPSLSLTFGGVYTSVNDLLSNFAKSCPSLIIDNGTSFNGTNFILDISNNSLRLQWSQYTRIKISGLLSLGFGVDTFFFTTTSELASFDTGSELVATRLTSDNDFYVPLSNTVAVPLTAGMYQVVTYTNAAANASFTPRYALWVSGDPEPTAPNSSDYYFSDSTDFPSGLSRIANSNDFANVSTSLSFYFPFNPLVPKIANNFIVNSCATVFVKLNPSGVSIIRRPFDTLVDDTERIFKLGRLVSNIYAIDKYLYVLTTPVNGQKQRTIIYDTTTLSETTGSITMFERQTFLITAMVGFNNLVFIAEQDATADTKQCQMYSRQLGSTVTSGPFRTFAGSTNPNPENHYITAANCFTGFSIIDGVVMVQSGIFGCNLIAMNQTTTTVRNNTLVVEPQQYSCVLVVNQTAYLLPSFGNIITTIDVNTTVSSFGSATLRTYDIRNSIGAGSTGRIYDIKAAPDSGNGIYFLARDVVNNTANLLLFDRTTAINIPASWTVSSRQSAFVSNTVLFNSGTFLVPSSINNSLIRNQAVAGGNPYLEYSYPGQSILSNITTVVTKSGDTFPTAYFFPGPGSPVTNIVTFNFQNYTFGTISHNAVVYDILTIDNNFVIINPTSINLWSINTMTPLPFTSTFPNPTGTIVSDSYDGRYLTIFTGQTTVIYDFLNISTKEPVVYTGTIGSGQASIFYEGNLFVSNQLSTSQFLRFGTNPRSYVETERFSSPLYGINFLRNNIYTKSDRSLISIPSSLSGTTTTVMVLNDNSILKDTLLLNSNLILLTDTSITSVNVFTRNQNWEISKTTDFNRQLVTDGSNIYVSSSTNLDILRTNGLTSVTAKSSEIIENPSGSLFYTHWFDGSNIYLVSSTNRSYIYNANNSPFYRRLLPSRSQNVYHTNIVDNFIYMFPGSNVLSNTIQVYDTTKSFTLSSSYSNIILDNFYDIRSSVITPLGLIGCGYNSTNLITIDTVTKTQLPTSYFIDVIANVSSNNFISPVYDGRSFTVTPANGNTLCRVFRRPFITASSFDPQIPIPDLSNLVSFVQNGNTMYIVGSNIIYQYDLNTFKNITDNDKIIIPDTLPSSRDMNWAFFDGRFLKFFTNTLNVFDTIPLTEPKNFYMSCIANYALISSREKEWLQSQELKYPVTQVQTAKINLIKTSGFYKMNFTNMVKELIFVVGRGEIQNVELYLNGYSKSRLDSTYLKDIGNYIYHSRTPDSNIYSYSLTTVDGNGYLNMSRINEQVLFIKTTATTTLSVFALSDNILTIKDGLGGLVFGTRER